MYHTFISIPAYLLLSWLQPQECCLLGFCLKMHETKHYRLLLVLLPSDSILEQQAGVTSHQTSVKRQNTKYPLGVCQRQLLSALSMPCVLGWGWNSTSICCYCPLAIVWQVARWDVAVTASSFIPSSHSKAHGLRVGECWGVAGFVLFLPAFEQGVCCRFWSSEFLSLLLLCFSTLEQKMFLQFTLVVLVLCKEESLHCVWCLPVSTYNLVTDSSFGSRLLQLSTLYGSEGVCCRVLHSNFIE